MTRYAYGIEMIDFDTLTGRVEREPFDLAGPEQERYAIAECPSVAASVSLFDNTGAMTVAGEYDACAQELNDAADGEMNGVIGESDAREAWFAAIDDLQERGDVDAVAAGWEIAIALGWERSPEGEGEDDR